MVKRCLNCMDNYREEEINCPFCGKIAESPSVKILKVGTILRGRFIVGTQRGQRKNDISYIGWDELFSRKVMILELFPEKIVERIEDGSIRVLDGLQEKMEEARREFIKECEKLILLDGVPGVLNMLCVFEERGSAYGIYEYPGEITLRDVLKNRGIFSVDEAEWLMSHLSVTLNYTHSINLYHGNISLDNCYVCPSGDVRLGMFHSEIGKSSRERIARDIINLAELCGCILMGLDLWNTGSMNDKWQYISKYVSVDAAKLFFEIFSRTKIPESIQRFVDLFTGEATIELYGG